ncbi:TetR/AcrR family transcriptional regulator [Phytomonospora endophytica]|uniref:AcrR family transcriptional regulator n=1 Tax=Phytomonospora endophytica TaxID=714109 RepID=A0A841FX45_9ACTN|nr:TetR family transcriptional regulator [Phytomonospora endophytica]MBB6036540.1 AcrR family transcriptional regulator [Phytomonospora endophytica]GIG65862.1 TetR family transcriptional regulator [Phytomonospora endophytica]
MTTTRKSTAGRRPGDSGTRETILDAATAAFLGLGYDGATMRGIARAADVDAALVVHFFGSKDGLFKAVLAAGVDPIRRIAAFADGPDEGLGDRLIRHYLDVWEAPDTSARMTTVLRALALSSSAVELLKGFIGEAVLGPLSGRLNADEAPLRAGLCGAHLAGLSLTRYILKVEPIASLDPGRLAAIVGPCLQHYLSGELGEPPAT